MTVLERLVRSLKPAEPDWCCDRCRQAAMTAEAERREREVVHQASGRSRVRTRSVRATTPPVTHQAGVS